MTKIKKARKNKINVHFAPFKFLQYCLVIGDKELKKVCKEFNLDYKQFEKFNSGARLTTFTADDGSLKISILRLLESYRHGPSEINVCALSTIAHETTHIKQILMESINEPNPSIEFEAYLMEEIYGNMVQDYLNRI